MKVFERCLAALAASAVLFVGIVALTWPFIVAFVIVHFVVKWW